MKLLLVTYKAKYWNGSMVARCQDISLAVDFTLLCATAGSGRICTLMQ